MKLEDIVKPLIEPHSFHKMQEFRTQGLELIKLTRN